jgi:hypothetical protein
VDVARFRAGCVDIIVIPLTGIDTDNNLPSGANLLRVGGRYMEDYPGGIPLRA